MFFSGTYVRSTIIRQLLDLKAISGALRHLVRKWKRHKSKKNKREKD